jgi:hypothetical protein
MTEPLRYKEKFGGTMRKWISSDYVDIIDKHMLKDVKEYDPWSKART